MQFAKMIDLIQQAKQAGERDTVQVNEALAEAFDIWIDEQDLGEITDEEYDHLKLAFDKGYGICLHDTK